MGTMLRWCVFVASVAMIYDQCTKWWTISRLEEVCPSAFGLVRADRLNSHGRAHGIDIIFVHGLGSNPNTTWGTRNGKSWVTDFLSEDIPESFHKDVRIFFYNYDSYWKRDAVQTRLWNLGKSLLEHIASDIRATEEERTRNILFVGHSYGGLVIKRALIQARTDRSLTTIAEHTKAVFFLGTPHRGSSFTTMGKIAARALQPLGSNPSILEEITYDSLPLLELHEEFENAFSERLRVVNFFEQRKTRLLKVWFIQWEEFCVPQTSAKYGKVNIGLPVDHYGLNKFGSKNENYRIILGKILEVITPMASKKQQQIYSVPFGTVESYTERPLLSTAVHQKLRVHHPKAHVPHALAIYGLGGTGKTQLALKYIEDHKEEYDPILWIDAKDEVSVRSSFERCASQLQLPVDRTQAHGSSLSDSPAVQTVLRWLRSRKETDEEWLMVVDNADDMYWGIKKVLPRGNRGNVIITSQDSRSHKLIDGGCERLRVDTMEPLEARALLLERFQWDLQSVPDDVREDCDKIAEQLGYLALAIDLAGAYISNDDDTDQRQALQQYVADYAKHQDDLLKSDHNIGLSASDKTVWTVWETTVEKLERRHTDLRPGLLLAFLGHFKGRIIQDEMFRLASLRIDAVVELMYDETAEFPEWLSKLLVSDGKEWDSFSYRKCRDLLVRYGLLQRTKGEWPGVTMHGLVQWRAVRLAQDQPWDRSYLTMFMAACDQLTKEVAKPQFRRHMITHVPDLSRQRLKSLMVNEQRAPFVYSAVGVALSGEGMWKEAENLFRLAVDIQERTLGDESLSTLTNMANLAMTYNQQGRWISATKLLLKVVGTSKNALGEEHSFTLASVADLASTYMDQGKWTEAEELFMEVLKTSTTKSGLTHPFTIITMSNLALVYSRSGRWKEAEELFVQVVAISKKVLGEEHPSTLTSMSNLAMTYTGQGLLEQAEELEVGLLKASERVLGEEHPDTLTSMSNLAATYTRQERWEDAEELFVQVIEISKKVLGGEHPDVLISLDNLASTYWRHGRRDEGRELFVQVAETSKRVLGEDHPDTLIALANLEFATRFTDG